MEINYNQIKWEKKSNGIFKFVQINMKHLLYGNCVYTFQ